MTPSGVAILLAVQCHYMNPSMDCATLNVLAGRIVAPAS